MAISGFSLELTQSMANLYGNSCTPQDFVFSAADSRACSCCKAETAFEGERRALKIPPSDDKLTSAQVQLWVSAFNGFNVARLLLSSAPPTNAADTYPISCASRRRPSHDRKKGENNCRNLPRRILLECWNARSTLRSMNIRDWRINVFLPSGHWPTVK